MQQGVQGLPKEAPLLVLRTYSIVGLSLGKNKGCKAPSQTEGLHLILASYLLLFAYAVVQCCYVMLLCYALVLCYHVMPLCCACEQTSIEELEDDLMRVKKGKPPLERPGKEGSSKTPNAQA